MSLTQPGANAGLGSLKLLLIFIYALTMAHLVTGRT